MLSDTILQEALQLPVKDRAAVAAELLASLEVEPLDDPREVQRAWAAEIERRAQRVLAGDSEGRPWEDVRQRIEKRLLNR